MACPTVRWPLCLLCSWTCWVWYRCCWVSLPHSRSRAGTLETCWCTRGPSWCCCPWPAGSCGTAATLRAWPPERSWEAPWVTLWTALPALWVAGYGSPGLTVAPHRRWIWRTAINNSWHNRPHEGVWPNCLRQESALTGFPSDHKHCCVYQSLSIFYVFFRKLKKNQNLYHLLHMYLAELVALWSM